MRAFIFAVLGLLLQGGLSAQPRHHPNKIKVEFHILPVVRDSSDLNAVIVIKNIADTPVSIFNELLEDVQGGPFESTLVANLLVTVEQKRAGKYQYYSRDVHSDPIPDLEAGPAIPELVVNPLDSISWFFRIDSRYSFEIGNFRIKCRYWYDAQKESYADSKWIYFRVNKPIYSRPYFEKESGLMPRRPGN